MNPPLFDRLPHITCVPTWLRPALDFCVQRVQENLAHLQSFPERTENGKWLCVKRDGWWIGGHWTGLIWLAFAYSQDPALEEAARVWCKYLVARQYDTHTHDLGFLFELSHLLGYRLTGDPTFKAPALQAARSLSRRFNPLGGFIQAWGPLDASPELRGRAIIDTMMNLELLFWAGRETGNPDFSRIAETHARRAMRYQVRPDYSTAHVMDFDPQSGKFIRQATHQGLSAQSCWSRGQSWAVYGFANCFRATDEAIFLATARGLAHYALQHLPADRVPYWDYNSPDIPDDVRDSSAASILACGLLNLAGVETDPKTAQVWCGSAESILQSLWEHYSSRDTGEPCILLHGTRSKPHNLADHGLIYGDYYFMEALLRWMAANQVDDDGK